MKTKTKVVIRTREIYRQTLFDILTETQYDFKLKTDGENIKVTIPPGPGCDMAQLYYDLFDTFADMKISFNMKLIIYNANI